MRKFQIDFSPEAVADLRDRLTRWRRPPPISGSNWEDGTDGDYLADFVDHWLNRYDWFARQEELNRLDHYQTDVDGMTIHFIHARGKGPRSMPLLLLHGWPSSFVQMLDILPLLTEERGDGTPSFDVVLVSMPSYPFTTIPREPGVGFFRIAELLVKLMVDELGYERFAARGTDQGAMVQQHMGLRFPERLIGLHRSGISPYANPMPGDLSPAEREYQAKVTEWAGREQTFSRLQQSRPETLTPALADSPVGLAAWMLEKFQRWGDVRGNMDGHYGRDRLIDNMTLHWLAGTGAASIRLYREWARDPSAYGRIDVPTAFMMPLADGAMVPAPREWAERYYNVKRWTMTDRGGHFPEWEVPELVADDMRSFFGEIAAA